MCPVSYKLIGPVCGTDSKTYSSICELEAARLTVAGLDVAKLSPCSQYCGEIWDPLCGTDLVTYANHCLFTAALRMMPNLKVFHVGQCMTPMPVGVINIYYSYRGISQFQRQFGFLPQFLIK